MPTVFLPAATVLARKQPGISLPDSLRVKTERAGQKPPELSTSPALPNQTTSRYKTNVRARCWTKRSCGVLELCVGGQSAGKKKTIQMPIARRDKMSYERHNRIVHLLKTECFVSRRFATAVYAALQPIPVSYLQVRRMPTDMPAIFSVPVSFLKLCARHQTA